MALNSYHSYFVRYSYKCSLRTNTFLFDKITLRESDPIEVFVMQNVQHCDKKFYELFCIEKCFSDSTKLAVGIGIGLEKN